jgi:hypothetical protein
LSCIANANIDNIQLSIKSMNKIGFIRKCCLLFLVCAFFSPSLQAQEYILLRDDFENRQDTSWIYTNSIRSNEQSYKGQYSLEVSAKGEASYLLAIPEGVKELEISGWANLYTAARRFEEQAYSSIEVELVGQESAPLKGGIVGRFYQNTPWTYFEGDIKLPKGTKAVRIVCKNTFEDAARAFFDELRIEKRQIGFVKKETSWGLAVKRMKDRSSQIVKNGNFEDGAEVWDGYWGFQLSTIARTGQYSGMIQNSDSGAWKGSTNMDLFRIPPGTSKLKVSAWIKADNVVGGPNAWETGALLLTLTDENGNEVPGGEAVARTVGTHDWKKFEAYFPITERSVAFRLSLQLAASTGKIYFDDIEAVPMTEQEYYMMNIVLKNPGFEELLSGWPAFAGEATSEDAHSGQYSLKVAGEEASWAMRLQTVSVVHDKKELTFSMWMKTVGITETPNVWEGARIYLEFKDINGIELNVENVGRAVGTTDWELYSATVPIPEDAVEFTIYCGRANVSGNAYFDDALLEYK